MRRMSLLVLGLLLSIGVSSCATAPPPTVVELTIKAAPNINPDGNKRPSPVILRVYQLAGTGAFEKADFFPLYNKEGPTLGADLLGREQILVVPGDRKTVRIDFKPQARSIGVIAAFRDINQAAWRVDAPVPPEKTTKFTATVDALTLKLTEDQ